MGKINIQISSFLTIITLFLCVHSVQAGGGRLDFSFGSDYQDPYSGLPAWTPGKSIPVHIVAWEDSNRVNKSVGEHFDIQIVNGEIADECHMTKDVTDSSGTAEGECTFATAKQAEIKLLEKDKGQEGQHALLLLEYNLPKTRAELLNPQPTATPTLIPTNTPIPPTPTLVPTVVQPKPTVAPVIKVQKLSFFQSIVVWFMHIFKK
jgi:hypothetical protein